MCFISFNIRKPEWMKESGAATSCLQTGDSDDRKLVFEVFEMFKIDGNSETLFRPVYKLAFFMQALFENK